MPLATDSKGHEYGSRRHDGKNMANRLVVEELADGRVAIALQRTGHAFPETAGEPVPFASPFGEAEHEALRWYLEDYIAAPFAVYEERGEATRKQLASWGEALFTALFGTGKPGREAYNKAREDTAELVVISRSAGFASLPWELLKDPRQATPLALGLAALDRTLVSEGAAAPIPPGNTLRVLMVIARPAGVKDVGYQMIARPLLERLMAVRGQVQLEVLRPPTLEVLNSSLSAATAEGKPYHILHFDGHGTFRDTGAGVQGYLAFEAEGGGEDWVPADEFALVVNQSKVPLVVLNACRSGMVGQAAVEASIAARLLEGGAASVVAMGYSVYAVAAAEFMAAFYEALFAGNTVSAAAMAGRQRLYSRRERPSLKGMLPLEDWLVPVHYLRRTICFAELHRSRPQGLPPFEVLLDQQRHRGSRSDTAASEDPLASVGRFVGRDAAFYTLELALRRQRVVVVKGPAGTGKTELAKAFGRWWQASRGVDQPGWVFFHSFKPGVATFGLDEVVTAIGLEVYGLDFKTNNASERHGLILDLLRQHRMLLIWDNFESVCSLPDPTGATPPLDAAQQKRIRAFLHEIARTGRSGVIITSRTPEEWLGNVQRIELGGLTLNEAADMAEDVLGPYPIAQRRRQDRSYAELLEWLHGHPLSLRLLLPELETRSAESVLAALKSNATQLPPGFVAERWLMSLGASLKYSYDHLPAEMRQQVPALALFEGVVDEVVLGLLSTMEDVPLRFQDVKKVFRWFGRFRSSAQAKLPSAMKKWTKLLQQLTRSGLLTSVGTRAYRLHPALPAYVAAEWHREANIAFAAEYAATEEALLKVYAFLGEWLSQEIHEGPAELALGLIERHRHTMRKLLALALQKKRYLQAFHIFSSLSNYLETRGLREEVRHWANRCRAAVEAVDGTPPDIGSEAGILWIAAENKIGLLELENNHDVSFKVFKKIQQHAQHLDDDTTFLFSAAYMMASAVFGESDLDGTGSLPHKSFETDEAPRDQWRAAIKYFSQGYAEKSKGNIAGAEISYRKSAEISKMIDNQLLISRNYLNLGDIAQDRGDLITAENWYRKSVEISEKFGDRSVALIYITLGLLLAKKNDLAEAENWYRKSVKISKVLGDWRSLARGSYLLGILALERDEPTTAENWLRKSLIQMETHGDRNGMSMVYILLGVVAQDRGDLAAAKDWYRKSLEIKEPVGDWP